MAIVLLAGKEQNSGAFPSLMQKGDFQQAESLKGSLFLGMMRFFRVLMQREAEQLFCGWMAWGEKEVIMIPGQMLLKGKDLAVRL